VKVRNIATGEEKTFSQHHLALGVTNTLVGGRFYEQPQLAMYYFCESVQADLTHLYLVESFQHGQLIQAEFTVKMEYANRYVPVSDQAVLQRLRRRLDRLKPAQKDKVSPKQAKARVVSRLTPRTGAHVIDRCCGGMLQLLNQKLCSGSGRCGCPCGKRLLHSLFEFLPTLRIRMNRGK
jgi:hypothetical protein